jgi:hypothetical protein
MRTSSNFLPAFVFLLLALVVFGVASAAAETKGSISAQVRPCCLCVADSSSSRFRRACESWAEENRNNCETVRIIEIDEDYCWDKLPCQLGEECRGRPINLRYEGHSSPRQCVPYTDYSVRLCLENGASCLRSENSGCSTFANIAEALAYIGGLGLPENCLQISITGNQIPSISCKPEADSAITITVTADCARCEPAKCNFGESCVPETLINGNAQACMSAVCTDSETGSWSSKVCCPSGPWGGQWAREGTCPSCEAAGACCVPFEGRSFCRDEANDPSNSVSNQASCQNLQGAWRQGATCEDTTCPELGMCCQYLKSDTSVHKNCKILSEEGCNLLPQSWRILPGVETRDFRREWTRGAQCSESTCPPKGACCFPGTGDLPIENFPGRTCLDLETSSSCATKGGAFHEGTTCYALRRGDRCHGEECMGTGAPFMGRDSGFYEITPDVFGEGPPSVLSGTPSCSPCRGRADGIRGCQIMHHYDGVRDYCCMAP